MIQPTRNEIVAAIDRLVVTIRKEISNELLLKATALQQFEVNDAANHLILRLSQAKSQVLASTAFAVDWETWVEDSISHRIESFSKLLNILVAEPLGVCTYPGGSFCSTQEECDLPNSSWSLGGCS